MTNKQPLGPWQEAWLETLESGEFEQGRGYLCREVRDGEFEFCCLGLMEEVAIENGEHREVALCEDDAVCDGEWRYFSMTKYPTTETKELMRLARCAEDILGQMNDIAGLTFSEIAAKVREDPSRFFEGPA